MLDRLQLNGLYRYGLSLTNEPAGAEDLLQSAIERWLPKRDQTREPLPYIRRIMRNLHIDECRRHALVDFESLDSDRDDKTLLLLDTQSLEQLTIDRQDLQNIFDHLNSAEREVLYYWAVLEYSTSEIAAELQEPRGTILSRLFRLKEKSKALAQRNETTQPAHHNAGKSS